MADGIVTEATAIYAALVASVTAAWTVYRDRNDTGKLEVSVGFRELAGVGPIEHDVLTWHVTSIGKRSMMLTHCCADLPDGKAIMVVDNQIPKRLEPGDYHMSLCRQYEFAAPIVRMYAVNSLGQKFLAPDKEVRVVVKKIAELKAKGITKSWRNG